VVSVPPDMELKDAVALMVERKIGCLPVVEKGRLVGLITETDILVQYCKELGGCPRPGPETG
jgi:acetoin utilization protein AcuB